jgi:hypothetical protein
MFNELERNEVSYAAIGATCDAAPGGSGSFLARPRIVGGGVEFASPCR